MAKNSRYLVHIQVSGTAFSGIRLMRLADLGRVYRLERQLFQDHWTLAHFRHEIKSNPVSWPLVVESEQGLLGYAVPWFVADEIHLANLAVTPEHRRKGIGMVLMALIIDEGIRRGARCAYLEVRPSNNSAIKLYKKCGFEEMGKRMGYYRDGEDALLMRRFIPDMVAGHRPANSPGRDHVLV